MAIILGETYIPLLFVGDMGIKSGYAGNEQVYEREGGYFYLDFSFPPDRFVPKGSAALITKDGSTFYVR